MAIKSVLASITGYETNSAALASGMGLAHRLGAAIDVLHVRPDARDAIPLYVDGASGALIGKFMEQAETEAESRANQAKSLYETACKQVRIDVPANGAKTRFITLVGQAADEVSARGRVHDLVMFCRAPKDYAYDWRLTVEDALLSSGHPILLLPAEPRRALGETVALAWNGSAEAARAASAALPILALARRVLLLSGARNTPVVPGLIEVGEWLERHGIAAERKKIALEAWPVGMELASEALQAGADFLVMGGYGHTRMREIVFGGATQAVLEDAALPVLLAH